MATTPPRLTRLGLVLVMVCLLPLLFFITCSAVYVVTGGDPLPGDNGGRWALLGVMSFVGLLAALTAAGVCAK